MMTPRSLLLAAVQALFLLGGRADPTFLVGAKSAPVSSIANAGEASLQLNVYYGEDRVNGTALAGSTVTVNVTDNVGTLKATASVTTAADTGFRVLNENWNSAPPDIEPGDRVLASTGTAEASVSPVGTLTGSPDFDQDTVAGTLQADLSGQLTLRCFVTGDAGSLFIENLVDADGGSYRCNFADNGWDLVPTDVLYVSYYEPDGDQVIKRVRLWLNVNYGIDSITGYASDSEATILVTDSLGALKGTAVVEPGWQQFFAASDESWVPEPPDIIPGDYVYALTVNIPGSVVQVGQITGSIDTLNDSITGTVLEPSSSGFSVPILCQPWGAWDQGIEAPTQESSVLSDGIDTFTCQWDPITEWDVEVGQEIAVFYVEADGDWVGNVFRLPAAHLRIFKDADGQAAAGGNFRFTISYQNVGDAAANDVTVTDYLPTDFVYLADSSGLAHSVTPESVIWTVGSLEPGSWDEFELFLQVPQTPDTVFTNTVEIDSTSIDAGGPQDRIFEWVGVISQNDTHLGVTEIEAKPNDPAPGQTFLYSILICNDGSTGSDDLSLMDTLPANSTLLDWWSGTGLGWVEVPIDPHTLGLYVDSFPGEFCDTLMVQTFLDPAATIGTELANTVEIDANNDLEPEDNLLTFRHAVGSERPNLAIAKTWSHGHLLPGGKVHYRIEAINAGNRKVDSVLIIDTLPQGTTFDEAWEDTGSQLVSFPPSETAPGNVIWALTDFEPGFERTIVAALDIDSTVAAGTTLVNSVQICAGEVATLCADEPLEQRYDDNQSFSAETIRSAGVNLRVSKAHVWLGGDEISYEIRFENIGSETVDGVMVTDTLPASTAFSGEWRSAFDRPLDFSDNGSSLVWQMNHLYPGEAGSIFLALTLDQPGVPLQTFNNTVEITTPLADVDPADNSYLDSAFSGGEVREVHLWVDAAASPAWGFAEPGTTVTLRVSEQNFDALADPACDGCWFIPDVGLIRPGDLIAAVAGSAFQPVNITVPSPFSALSYGTKDLVYGTIDNLDSEIVEAEIYGFAPRFEQTDSAGHFEIEFVDFPVGAEGEVRYTTQIDYATAVFHRSTEAVLFTDGFESGDTSAWSSSQ